MNTKTTSIFAIAMLLMCTFAAASIVSDSSDAYSSSKSYTYSAGQTFSESFAMPYRSSGSTTITGSSDVPSWVTPSGTNGYAKIDGTAPSTSGTYSFSVSFRYSGSTSYEYCTVNYTITVTAPSYTVSFSSGGGSVSPSSQTAESGSSITLPSPGTRSNYTFNGWYTASSGGSYVGTTGSSYTVSGDVTLYGQWTYSPPSSYYYAYLYFSANGGSGAPSTQSASIYATSASGSKTFTIPSTTPTLSGYNFLGWSTSSSASSPSYYSGSSISVSYGSSKTLYAVWSQITYSHTLYFNANGGSGAPSTQSSTNTSSSYSFTIPSTTPTYSGHTFLGWSTSSTATSASYSSGSTISVGANSSKTLYAVWQLNVVTLTNSAPDSSVIVNNSYTHTVSSNVSGVTVAVSGISSSCVSISGSTVTIIPTTAGSYNITLTVSKTNYSSASDSFTLTVVPELAFVNSPSAGFIIQG